MRKNRKLTGYICVISTVACLFLQGLTASFATEKEVKQKAPILTNKGNIAKNSSDDDLRPSGMVDQAKLLKAGELSDVVEGSPNAPVTIVEYYSLTCGHCALFYLQDLPTLRRKYIDTGKVRFIKREFPYDPRATAAFMLARCAPKDKYNAFIDVLFHQFMSWVPVKDAMTPLKNYAKLSGFTDKSFKDCLVRKDLIKKLNDNYKIGVKEFGITATPTFFINGEKYVGEFTADEMSKIIDNVLKNKCKTQI